MDFKWTRWCTHAFFLIQHKLQVAEEKKVPSSLQNKTWINAHGSDVVAITRRPGNYLLGPRSADPAQCPVLSLSGSRGGRRVQASLALKMSNNERTLKEEYILEYQVLWAKESETIIWPQFAGSLQPVWPQKQWPRVNQGPGQCAEVNPRTLHLTQVLSNRVLGINPTKEELQDLTIQIDPNVSGFLKLPDLLDMMSRWGLFFRFCNWFNRFWLNRFPQDHHGEELRCADRGCFQVVTAKT